MIGLLELATHSNIEQQSLEFIIYTMLPWVIKLSSLTARIQRDVQPRVTFANLRSWKTTRT
jgi:hypothetical protein